MWDKATQVCTDVCEIGRSAAVHRTGFLLRLAHFPSVQHEFSGMVRYKCQTVAC